MKALVVKFSAALIFLTASIPLHGQWMKAYGRDHGDFFPYSLRSTPDGGYIACGFLGSGTQWDTETHNWAVKFTGTGNIEWARSYVAEERSYLAEFFHIAPTLEGGYIAAGFYGIFKLDVLGNIEWKVHIDKHLFEVIRQTRDGGYITIANRGGGLGWGEQGHRILKLSSSGKIEWEREFAIGDHGDIVDVQEAFDGDFVVVGNTGFYKDGHGCWIMLVSPKGKLLRQHVYAGADQRIAHKLEIAPDGSLLVLGHTSDSFGFEIYQAVWITKILPSGEVAWHRVYEGGNPWPFDLCAADDGGCVFAGFSGTGGIVFKTDGSGEIEWERSFGDFQAKPPKADDRAYAVCPAADGGFTILGISATLGHIPDPDDTVHNFLVLLNINAGGFFPECPHTKTTGTIQASAGSFPMNPLTFGFRQPDIDPFRVAVTITELDLMIVDDLCSWQSGNADKTIKRKKRAGRRR